MPLGVGLSGHPKVYGRLEEDVGGKLSKQLGQVVSEEGMRRITYQLGALMAVAHDYWMLSASVPIVT